MPLVFNFSDLVKDVLVRDDYWLHTHLSGVCVCVSSHNGHVKAKLVILQLNATSYIHTSGYHPIQYQYVELRVFKHSGGFI